MHKWDGCTYISMDEEPDKDERMMGGCTDEWMGVQGRQNFTSTHLRFSAETITKRKINRKKINSLLLCAVLIRQGEPKTESL